MRIHVLKFTYRSQNPECADAIDEAMATLVRAGHSVGQRRWGSALIHASRNQAFGSADQDECDYLMMVDDDMLPSAEAMLQLVELDVPVASAICTTRVFPVQLAVKIWDKECEQFVQADKLRSDRPITGNEKCKFGVGAAFLLVRQDVRKRLLDYYLSANDWLEDNRRMFDRLHVRKELRERERQEVAAKRQYWWDKDRYCRVFDHSIDETQMQFGEDVGFSRRMLQLDIPITLDGRVTVGHLGDYPYTVADYIPEIEEGKLLDPRVGLAEWLAG
jgi:hypothetical protein